MKEITVRVRVSPEEHIDWKSQAKEGGVSMSELIRSRMNVATDNVALRAVKGAFRGGKVYSDDVPLVSIKNPGEAAVKEAIAKCKKLEGDYKVRNKRENEFRSYFKDKKSNER